MHEQSLQTNQGQRFVWVVNAENKGVQKAVKIGWQTENGMRVILEGLESSDRVIVTGVQRVRDKKNRSQALQIGNRTGCENHESRRTRHSSAR